MASNGISIPGVSDKYKTNDLVDSLIAVERKPLVREQENLEKLKLQQDAWRTVNQKMTSLRDSVKSLYSFENPFNNKLTESSEEYAVTADAARNAEYGSFKIDIINTATADKFMSANVDRKMNVEKGTYTFTVGNKSVSFNWKGGSLNEFVSALNKRGGETVHASLIGVTKDKSSLIIESFKTGEGNKLEFKDKALEFAKSIEMIQAAKTQETQFDSNIQKFKTPDKSNTDEEFQQNMPALSKANVQTKDGKIQINPRGGIQIDIPDNIKNDPNQKIEFTLASKKTEDITEAINKQPQGPVLPEPGKIDFKGVQVYNNPSDTKAVIPEVTNPLKPIETDKLVYIKNNDGSEQLLDSNLMKESDEGKVVSFTMKDYPDATAVIIRNPNTGRQLTMSVPKAYDPSKSLGYMPVHPITVAQDATIKYEGITISRPDNDIDDIVPDITLHLHNATEKTATITISPDSEGAKDALIQFVGRYNQTIAELTILSTNKQEVINELDYLSDKEVEDAGKKLGMFMSDYSLTDQKAKLQQITSAPYRFDDDTTISMLSQIGISTNASSTGAGYNAAQLRGYLEVDEKKLDSVLENSLDQIKNLFGYDTDGDLIIDNGIAYMMDKQLGAWVQSGGILSIKNSTLDRSIKASNQKITQLESQIAKKESELRRKYSAMEGTLNSLEGQTNAINNFTNQGNNNR